MGEGRNQPEIEPLCEIYKANYSWFDWFYCPLTQEGGRMHAQPVKIGLTVL